MWFTVRNRIEGNDLPPAKRTAFLERGGVQHTPSNIGLAEQSAMTPSNSSRGSRIQVVAVMICCFLAAMCEGLDLQAPGVAAVGIAPEFRAAPNQLGTLFSASTLGLLIGALIGGRLSDSLGRKRVLVVSIALFGIFSLLTAAAWDMASCSWARLLTGLGLGGALPNLLALVNECSPADRRSANVALVYAANPVGGAIASLISLLIQSTHWRWIFVVGGIAPLIVAPIMQAVMPDSPVSSRQSAASPAVATRETGGADPERGSFAAIFDQGRLPATLLLWTSFFLGLLTLYLLLSWLPTLLAGAGLSKTQAACAQIAFNLGGAASALLIGQLLEGRLRKVSVLVTFLMIPVLIYALASSPAHASPTIVAVFALGCAVVAAQAFLYSEAPALYPDAIRGVGVGAAVAVGRLGSIVGPKLGGILKSAGQNSSQLLMDLLPLIVVGSVVAIALLYCSPQSAPRCLQKRVTSR